MIIKRIIPESLLNYAQRRKREYELARTEKPSVALIKTLSEIEQYRNTPILFAGYPKSGNTWLRFLLYHYLELFKRDIQEPLKYSELTALQYDSLENGIDRNMSLDVEIIRTHLNYNSEFSKVFHKYIFVYRHPLDVLVSAWHFFVINRKGPTDLSPNNNIDNYVKYNLVNWVYNYKSYCDLNSFSTSYELLKKDAGKELRKLLTYLNVEINELNIDKAVRLSDFKSIKKMTIDSGETHGSGPKEIQKGVFTRKGEVGAYKNELKDKTIAFAEKYLRRKGVQNIYKF